MYLYMLTRKIQIAFTLEDVLSFAFFFFLCMIICKLKFGLAFKTEATFKVAVKQLQAVGHPTGNATFVVSKTEKSDFNHFQAIAQHWMQLYTFSVGI